MEAFDTSAVLLLNAAATLYMTGVIWFVQIVHYPLMDGVGRDAFASYEGRNTRRTTCVVVPPMLLELATAVMLAFRPAAVPTSQAWLGLALVGAVWISTAALQVPQHRRLGTGFDAAAHRWLVATNWIRVVAWTARSGLVLVWLG